MPGKEHLYKGREITIRWDAERCIHVAECLRRLPVVFNIQRRVWVAPDAAGANEISETVQYCPTGALHYVRRDGSGEIPPLTNQIYLRIHGPLWVHGDLVVVDERGTTFFEDTRVALCRCGMSGKKPLCDNSHIPMGFKDRGRLGKPETEKVESATGRLIITPTENGPFELTGRVEITASDGRSVCFENPALCRCGSSRNKPFCDGSHEDVGFISSGDVSGG
jgi:CDGSH-type Zn-finger protein/uncharacterized Fe-S cluster protein YjdI